MSTADILLLIVFLFLGGLLIWVYLRRYQVSGKGGSAAADEQQLKPGMAGSAFGRLRVQSATGSEFFETNQRVFQKDEHLYIPLTRSISKETESLLCSTMQTYIRWQGKYYRLAGLARDLKGLEPEVLDGMKRGILQVEGLRGWLHGVIKEVEEEHVEKGEKTASENHLPDGV